LIHKKALKNAFNRLTNWISKVDQIIEISVQEYLEMIENEVNSDKNKTILYRNEQMITLFLYLTLMKSQLVNMLPPFSMTWTTIRNYAPTF